MRVVVLAHCLRVAGGLSVGQNTVATLPKVGRGHDYLMIVPKGFGYKHRSNCTNVSIVEVAPIGLPARLRFEFLQLHGLVRRFSPDVILGLGNLGLDRPPCKQVILFHKPQLIYPARYYAREKTKAKFKNWLLKQKLKRCLSNTQLVFCQTPVAKKRFAHEFRYPTENIRIMHNAVSEFAKVDKQHIGIPEVLREKDYFNLFYLTKFYAHKNLEVIIDIFRRCPDKLKDVRCIVTVSPEQHPNALRFLKNILKYNLEKHIINVGPLKQTELASYFCNADALFFPTLLESFSSTYLEAMHFGLPILTSDLDFARYICDDAAVYFAPWEPADVVEKILTMRDNGKLRTDLVLRGKNRISSFFKTWEEITAGVIKELEIIVNEK